MHRLSLLTRRACLQLSCTVLVLTSVLSCRPAIAQDPVYPGAEWEYVWRNAQRLDAYGWSADGLRQAWEFIRDSSNTTGLVVIDRGRVVFQFGDVEELSYLASVRKRK